MSAIFVSRKIIGRLSVSVSSSPVDLVHLMYGGLLLFPQKEGLDIMFLLLMIVLSIVGFI